MSRRTNKRPGSLLTKTGPITYILTRSSRRRTVMIQIDRAANVKVSAPFYARLEEIHRFISVKSEWITRKVTEAQKQHTVLSQKTYAQGQEFLFLGKKFALSLVASKFSQVRIEFDGSQWQVYYPDCSASDSVKGEIKRELIQWYRLQAQEIMGGRVFHFARQMGLDPQEVVIRTQKRLWGSCHPQKGSIHLNWQLIMTPLRTIDYVVVHELCHLKVADHSARFWREVHSVLPDYKERAAWLKHNSADMVLP